MQYSPKLKKAASEIEKILIKYDIAGTFVIHTLWFSEYMNKLNTSYSCVKNTVEGVRIKATKELYGSAEKRDQALKDTTNMLHHLSSVTGNNALMLIELSDKMDEITDAEHFGGGHSSSQTQNN